MNKRQRFYKNGMTVLLLVEEKIDLDYLFQLPFCYEHTGDNLENQVRDQNVHLFTFILSLEKQFGLFKTHPLELQTFSEVKVSTHLTVSGLGATMKAIPTANLPFKNLLESTWLLALDEECRRDVMTCDPDHTICTPVKRLYEAVATSSV